LKEFSDYCAQSHELIHTAVPVQPMWWSNAPLLSVPSIRTRSAGTPGTH